MTTIFQIRRSICIALSLQTRQWVLMLQIYSYQFTSWKTQKEHNERRENDVAVLVLGSIIKSQQSKDNLLIVWSFTMTGLFPYLVQEKRWQPRNKHKFHDYWKIYLKTIRFHFTDLRYSYWINRANQRIYWHIFGKWRWEEHHFFTKYNINYIINISLE